MNIKKGDMVSIKQDFIDRNNRYEYDSRDIWEVKEVYKMGGGYHVAVINNLTGYGSAHLCTYNMDLRTIDDLKARLLQDDNIAKVKNNNINTCKIMEKRMITKPFDLELAKKISNGEYDGEIVTVGHNHKVELVYYNKDRGMFNTLGVIYSDYGITSDWFSDNGGRNTKLRHKFRNQILEYWGEDTGILIGTTMVYERHLWNEEVKVI